MKTVIVTRDVEARYRGFLTSVMLEAAPGVYLAPDKSAGVQERVWDVVTDWWSDLGRGSLTVVWRDPKSVDGLCIKILGEPAKTIVDADGDLLLYRKQMIARSPNVL